MSNISRQCAIIGGDVSEVTIKGREDLIFLMYLCESQETFRYMLEDIERAGGTVAELDKEGFEISIERAWQFYDKYINAPDPEQYAISRIVELCNTPHRRSLEEIKWLEQEF